MHLRLGQCIVTIKQTDCVWYCSGPVTDLVDSPPVLLVVPQHASPQHVHHLWELLIHEGGSVYTVTKEKETGSHCLLLEKMFHLQWMSTTSNNWTGMLIRIWCTVFVNNDPQEET